MKAIKYLSLLFLFSAVIFACKTKQAKQSLDQTTKDYFSIKDGSTFTFVDVSDTNTAIEYTSSGYFNNQSNPDIENSEVMGYELHSPGKKTMQIRSETGGAQFKDRIAMITNRNDTNFAGPIIFNTAGNFSTIQNSLDSVYQLPSYSINGKVFQNVLKIVMKQNIIYKEIYYAKYIGLIAKKERDGTFLYAKKFSVNR